jgi:hypothetical protein
MPDNIPSDDLYARLGVPTDADTATIDRAWRALLKQHHPDVAGAMSLELAKLINVAHDWLADGERRARYDAAIRERQGHRSGHPGARSRRPSPAPPRPRRTTPRPQSPPRPAPPDDLDEVFGASAAAIRSFLAQAASLTADDLDRLSVAEPQDPADELRELIPPELWTRIEAIDARLAKVLLRAALRDPVAATAARGYGHALVLELFLWYYLADPETMLEGMRRGWESAVGLPRYGPNTVEVAGLMAWFRAATPGQAAALAATWSDLGEPRPWPADAWEFDFAALEVSAALARRDAARAAAAVAPRAGLNPNRLAAAFESTAHVVTLRPIFGPHAFAPYQQAWAPLGAIAARRAPGQAPTATIRRA